MSPLAVQASAALRAMQGMRDQGHVHATLLHVQSMWQVAMRPSELRLRMHRGDRLLLIATLSFTTDSEVIVYY